MGYQIATIKLIDGRQFKQAVIVEGRLTRIRGLNDVPFTEEQIADIILTHDKWDFGAEDSSRTPD